MKYLIGVSGFISITLKMINVTEKLVFHKIFAEPTHTKMLYRIQWFPFHANKLPALCRLGDTYVKNG
jgi:hypothetical protein